MAKRSERDNVPLSRLSILVAQLESIVASASQQPPDPLLCFDLLSDLVNVIQEEPKESVLLCQRKCEDALYSLLTLGACRPVRRLASLAMSRLIANGDGISIYSRASSLQGWLSDGKRSDLSSAGAAQCMGELYRCFGGRITSGLSETTHIAGKLMRIHEDFVRQEALQMLGNALEGSGGIGASAAYSEAFRIVLRVGVSDKSFLVRLAAAKCLKSFASVGGPGLGVAEFETSASQCVKGLEDPVSSVRDAFAEALGALLALSMNPGSQVQQKGKGHSGIGKKLEGGLQKHLTGPFVRASGVRSRELRVGLALSWVFFLQAMHLKYLLPDGELQSFALQAMDMLQGNSFTDAHSLACVLYVLRVGLIDQMTEPTQRSFLVLMGKQLESPDISPYKAVAVLRTLSYLQTTLGEVPREFREVIDNTVVAALSYTSALVRIEAALTLRTLAEVDPICVGGLISYGVTTLQALRENAAGEKGERLKVELDSLHGQAVVLAALVSISPKLILGYPAKLPVSVLNISKKMLTEFCRNPVVAAVEKEAGWLLLASLLSSMPKEELEEHVFDIMSLWAGPFGGNPDMQMKQIQDMTSELRVWSSAIGALTGFIRSFILASTIASIDGIFLQPALYYLSRALYYVTSLAMKPSQDFKPEINLLVIRTLVAYQALSDPLAYKKEHPQILEICTSPFRDPSAYEESSSLTLLLDKRDACLGPWVPGRDWLEDELRAFEGGKDGLLPCVWENELSSFPQPETIGKMLVNQMLLCFGSVFAAQDNNVKLELLGMIEQSLKAGRKQSWHGANMTNACVALLASLKAMIALRTQALAMEVLNFAQAVFQIILAEGDISAAQRRASAEGLGLVARLGNDIFTPRMTRLLLSDLVTVSDPGHIGSIALSLGCIHCSAGGMALSAMVPATVNALSSLAKSADGNLRVWSLHGLLLTIEAAGLSYASHVQATLSLVMDILLSEEKGWVDLRQEIGRLINVIVAVLGPELSPESIFFSRCKSVVAEISSGQETSTLLECVRFTQQLVIFAPQALSTHCHVQTLLSTLSSRQPTLRHLAVSTLRHLIEKDPVAVVDEQIEVYLFHMLDEETDPEIGNLVRSTIKRLLHASCPSCPSRWISLCRKMVLATSTRNASENNTVSEKTIPSVNSKIESTTSYADDDEDMIASSNGGKRHDSDALNLLSGQKHLRYKTRAFAAECLSNLPAAVGIDPAHFDIFLARQNTEAVRVDWLVLHLHELVGLAYQISTSQFENMQPIGVELLNSIMDKFEKSPDPELPGHLLMEQYQAQLVSAVRTALNASSVPLLLESGLKLATRILTSSITSGDRVALNRLFALISRPLTDIKDLYYPSFAEWVACGLIIRLVSAHAAVKCYTYSFFSEDEKQRAVECMSLIPLFSKNANVLGNYWIHILRDYSFICFGLQCKTNYKPFLDGLKSTLVSSKVRACLDESWSVMLQAVVLDAVPASFEMDELSKVNMDDKGTFLSGYSMVKLDIREFNFLWGFALLLLFKGPQMAVGKSHDNLTANNSHNIGLVTWEVALLVLQSLTKERFFDKFISPEHCKELLQVLLYLDNVTNSSNSLILITQIISSCPEGFLEVEDIVLLLSEICVKCLHKSSESHTLFQSEEACKESISAVFTSAEALICHLKPKLLEKLVLAILSAISKCSKGEITDSWVSSASSFLQSLCTRMKKYLLDDVDPHVITILGAWQYEMVSLCQDCVKSIHMMNDKRSNSSKRLQWTVSFCIEQTISVAKLAYATLQCRQNKQNYDSSLFVLYKNCTKCIREVLTDSSVQVQTVGLHILKCLAQRELSESSDMESRLFILFLAGEHFGDFFFLIENLMKKRVVGETATTVGECLKILLLLQTLAQSNECQRDLLNLLLEALILVVSAAPDEHSQELNEVKSNAMKIVAHLAQISTSAVQFKELLLAMPVAKRQQILDIIRASVAGGPNLLQIMPPKSPVRLEEQIKVSAPPTASQLDEHVEEDDDDWDTFQSFPAINPSESSSDEGSGFHFTSADQSSVQESQPEIHDDFQDSHVSEPHDLQTRPAEHDRIESANYDGNEVKSYVVANDPGNFPEELENVESVANDGDRSISQEGGNVLQEHNSDPLEAMEEADEGSGLHFTSAGQYSLQESQPEMYDNFQNYHISEPHDLRTHPAEHDRNKSANHDANEVKSYDVGSDPGYFAEELKNVGSVANDGDRSISEEGGNVLQEHNTDPLKAVEEALDQEVPGMYTTQGNAIQNDENGSFSQSQEGFHRELVEEGTEKDLQSTDLNGVKITAHMLN